MILKTILTDLFDLHPHLSLVLDLILTFIILNSRDIRLILLYFTIVIINIIAELFFRQMTILAESSLTAQNIERLANQAFELQSNIRLSI